MTLFMLELRVADWPGAVSWYADVLGLRVALRDVANRFALLEAPGGGRLALKEGDRVPRHAGHVRLVFRVDDLDAERRRLLDLGVPVGEAIANDREHYREARLADPEGTAITLFAWV